MDDWFFPAALIGCFMAIFGGLFGSMAYQDHLIGVSADPLATACALDKDRACVILATRR